MLMRYRREKKQNSEAFKSWPWELAAQLPISAPPFLRVLSSVNSIVAPKPQFLNYKRG